MKFDKSQLALHAPWMAVATVLTVFLAGWYFQHAWRITGWPGGGSLPGLACGMAAASVVAFEMLLWPRKYFRRLRLIPAKYWMAAHIWLGLGSLLWAILHSGFHLGGGLPATLLILFSLTIVSGVYGLIMQNILPGIMLRRLSAETIHSEIEHVAARTVQDVRAALAACCGPPPDSIPDDSLRSEPRITENAAVVIGAVRELGLSRGRTLSTRNVILDQRDRGILWQAFEELRPFLENGGRHRSKFESSTRTHKWFADLRAACTRQSRTIINAMEQAHEQRRQFDQQRRLHRWLHNWIPLHIALSVAVTILLVVHIITALKYW